MWGIANSYRSAAKDCTASLLHEAMERDSVRFICQEIARIGAEHSMGVIDGEDWRMQKNKLKQQLPVALFHASFPDGKRRNESAKPSGLCILDLDGMKVQPQEWYKDNIAGKEAGLGIVLAHKTPSLEGLRLVFAIPDEFYQDAYRDGSAFDGRELELAQAWMAEKLGLQAFDTSCKDYARCSYLVPESYVLFKDEEGLFADRDLPDTSAPAAVRAPHEEPLQGEEAGADPHAPAEPKKFKGIDYQMIIQKWFEKNGGEPVEGERNTKLHRLAYHLRTICDDDADLLLEIMPRYGLEEDEMRLLIGTALKAKRTFITKQMAAAVSAASDEAESDKSVPWGSKEPPAMPKKLPDLVALLVSNTPKEYRPAVANAIFPSLGAHLWNTYFRYIDNVWHEATLMNVLMAESGAGKSCIAEPIRRIMKDIKQRDAINIERERAWKQEVNSAGANKDKKHRPEGLVIQVVHPDMTNPAFVMRMKEAEGHFLYSQMNEIEQFDSLKGNGRGGQQFQIICLAFDPGNTYGQTRVGTLSVTEEVCVRYNWNASTTKQKGLNYFRRVLQDGPVQRINFCTIPPRPIGSPMPVYGTYTDEFDVMLQPYIENLTKADGRFYIPEADKLAQKLNKHVADIAAATQSSVYENFSFRAVVIAWLKACVLYVANGYRWEKSIDSFALWSLDYDLWVKMNFFGGEIEEMQEGSQVKSVRSNNLLNKLSNTFALQDAELVRKECGKHPKGTRQMLYVWENRKLIKRLDNGNFAKL